MHQDGPDAPVSPTTVRCIQCQYDLSGTAVGGSCPECGTRVQESIHALLADQQGELPRNTAATASSAIALFSVCIPLAGALAMVLGIIARRQIANRDYHPGSRIAADLGIFLGGITTAFWSVYLVVRGLQ
jgi:hypothetical protein